MRSDPDCIFCKIIAGTIPATKVLDADDAIAFMDIGPVAEGHVLLIPREHYSTVDEMPSELAAAVLRYLPTLVKAVRLATGCEGVNVLQNNGRIAGQIVPHVHFHVIPRTSAGEFRFTWPAGQYAAGKMEALADAIRTNC